MGQSKGNSMGHEKRITELVSELARYLEFETDNDGQLVIYTGLRFDETGQLVTFETGDDDELS